VLTTVLYVGQSAHIAGTTNWLLWGSFHNQISHKFALGIFSLLPQREGKKIQRDLINYINKLFLKPHGTC
jgi:hypothetical protein